MAGGEGGIGLENGRTVVELLQFSTLDDKENAANPAEA